LIGYVKYYIFYLLDRLVVMAADEPESHQRDKQKQKTFIGLGRYSLPDSHILNPEKAENDQQNSKKDEDQEKDSSEHRKHERRSLKDRRRLWGNPKYKGPERRYHLRKLVKDRRDGQNHRK
jgi:hypothetical protein